MNAPKLYRVLIVACTVLAWVLIGQTVRVMLRSPAPPAAAKTLESESAFSASFALVEKALSIQPNGSIPRYVAPFEPPFKNVAAAVQPAAHLAATPAPVARPKLVLKGILLKTSPLSILANETGATFILGVGDSLAGQTIVSIGKTSVMLKDKHGAYEISVKE